MSSFLTVENVCKYYGTGEQRVVAADHISFTVEAGEFAVILGHSGAGKTTLLNILGGMDTCDEGKVTLDGSEISAFDRKKLTEYRRYDVGFVFQFYNLVQNLSALENVELASEICREPLDARTVLSDVGLADRMNNFPAESSSGWPSPVRLPKIPRSFCATSQLEPSTIKPGNPFLHYCRTPAAIPGKPSSSLPTIRRSQPWQTGSSTCAAVKSNVCG